jgi:hypothetical protein
MAFLMLQARELSITHPPASTHQATKLLDRSSRRGFYEDEKKRVLMSGKNTAYDRIAGS